MKLLLGMALWYSATILNASEYFVSQSGKISGDGSAASPWSLSYVLGNPRAVNPGDTIWIREGTYIGAFVSKLSGTPERPITVRNYANERVTIDGSLEIQGASTIYWGFEVTNSDPLRARVQWARPPGVRVFGPQTKLVNLIIHDAGQGIAWWDPSTDSEIHGCLIYNNGNSEFDHGIYAQNRDGTKYITDNIVFNNYGYGLHIFGSAEASLKGFSIRGNTLFNNGSLSQHADSCQNIIVGGGVPCERIELLSNFTYSGFRHGSVTIGSDLSYSGNQALQACYNYFADYVLVRSWKNVTFTGNTLIGPTTILTVQSSPPSPALNYTWDKNNYFSEELDWQPFNFGGADNLSGLFFSLWKTATGWDKNSGYVKGKPGGTTIFLRQNRYEPGRLNITIYNWGKQSTVLLDLKHTLQTGARYEIRNAQDFFGEPVMAGTFDGGLLNVPMTGLSVAKPIGLPSPPATGPEFNVFVLLPTNSPTNSLAIQKPIRSQTKLEKSAL